MRLFSLVFAPFSRMILRFLTKQLSNYRGGLLFAAGGSGAYCPGTRGLFPTKNLYIQVRYIPIFDSCKNEETLDIVPKRGNFQGFSVF